MAQYLEEKITLSVLMVPGRIGAVTVLFNSESVLEGFFRSIESQSYDNYEIFCVDNASHDSSAAMCRTAGHTVIANETNVGVAAANNQGIRAALAAGCEYVLLINNDVEFGLELFRLLLAGLKEHAATMSTPIMYYFDRPNVVWAAGGKFQPVFGYRCFHLGDGESDRGQFAPAHLVQHTPTCCVLLERGVFARIGMMDERYFVYHDDTDFMLRCSLAGERLILLPEAKLLHKVSSLTGGSESTFSVRMGTRNRIFMTTKFLGRLLGVPYAAALSAIYLLRRISGRDDAERHRLKQKSLLEGFRMAPNWLPYRS